MMTQLHPLLHQLLENGIEITMRLDSTGNVEFDLNTRAKSDMIASIIDDKSLLIKLRYDDTRIAEDFDDLLLIANYARHGRDYMGYNWIELLQKYKRWY